jgi:hypothetical protein
MKFILGDRLERALAAHFAEVRRLESGVSYSLEVAAGDVTYLLTPPAESAVGHGAHKLIHICAETVIPRGKVPAIATHSENATSPYVLLSDGGRAKRFYPVAAQEIESEGDILDILRNVLDPLRRSFNACNASSNAVRDLLTQLNGQMPDSTTLEHNRNESDQMVAVASVANPDSAAYFIDFIPPKSWIEQLGVYRNRYELCDTNIYDGSFQMLYERATADVDDNFKTAFSDTWNRDYLLKYWRLRACVVGGTLLFRMPFCTTKLERQMVGRIEFDALRSAMSNTFDMPFVTFSQPEIDRWLAPVVDMIATTQALWKTMGL